MHVSLPMILKTEQKYIRIGTCISFLLPCLSQHFPLTIVFLYDTALLNLYYTLNFNFVCLLYNKFSISFIIIHHLKWYILHLIYFLFFYCIIYIMYVYIFCTQYNVYIFCTIHMRVQSLLYEIARNIHCTKNVYTSFTV